MSHSARCRSTPSALNTSEWLAYPMKTFDRSPTVDPAPAGRGVVLDLAGKRKRIRTVPIPGWAKVAVDHWMAAAGITEGPLFRAVDKAGRVASENLSAQAVYLPRARPVRAWMQGCLAVRLFWCRT